MVLKAIFVPTFRVSVIYFIYNYDNKLTLLVIISDTLSISLVFLEMQDVKSTFCVVFRHGKPNWNDPFE